MLLLYEQVATRVANVRDILSIKSCIFFSAYGIIECERISSNSGNGLNVSFRLILKRNCFLGRSKYVRK